MLRTNTELLLQQDENRYVMFPIKDSDIWEMYKKQEDLFWRAQEVDLSKDMKDWDSLNADEKHFVSMILAFFAAILLLLLILIFPLFFFTQSSINFLGS